MFSNSSCLRHALSGQRVLDARVCDGKLLHGLEGRELRRFRILAGLGVQVPKPVQAHHVKGVEQLSAHGVAGVVAVTELVLVDHHARLGIGGNIVIAPAHGAGLVHVGEEGLDGLAHRVRAAKRSNGSLLGQRIGLLAGLALHDGLLAARYRPFRHVAPIPVLGEHGVRVEQLAFDLPEHELAVQRGRGPVHQAGRLIGRVVELLDADFLGDLAGHGDVLVGGHIPGQRDDEPQARLFRRVLVGGVDKAPIGREHFELVDHVRRGIVHVQREAGTRNDAVLLAPAVPEQAHDEAAHILDVVLLGLGELSVLLDRFRCAPRRGDPIPKLLKCQRDPVPPAFHAAVANADVDVHVCTS